MLTRDRHGVTYKINATAYRVMRKKLSVNQSRMFNISGVVMYINIELYQTIVDIKVIEYIREEKEMFSFRVIFKSESKVFIDSNLSIGNYINVIGELVIADNEIVLMGDYATCYWTDALRPVDPKYVNPNDMNDNSLAY